MVKLGNGSEVMTVKIEVRKNRNLEPDNGILVPRVISVYFGKLLLFYLADEPWSVHMLSVVLNSPLEIG